MIKITNGQRVITVTNGAFESTYRAIGYLPVDDVARVSRDAETARKALKSHGVDETQEESEAALTELLNGLEGKPVDQWSRDECAAFVHANNIDLGDAKRASAVKAKIKEFIALR